MSNKPIAINPDVRQSIAARESDGFVAEGLDYRDLNELTFKSQTDHVWGTSSQCTANTATFYTDSAGATFDKDDVAVTINEGDKILIAHNVTATANMLLDCGGVSVTIEMSKGVNWDLDTYDLDLGVTAGDAFAGDIELTGTGTLTVLDSRLLKIDHTAITIDIPLGQSIINGYITEDVKALVDGANISTDCNDASVFTVTLGGNRTLDNPTNKKLGKIYTWIITQDGTGSRALAFGTDFNFETPSRLRSAADSITVIKGTVVSSTEIRCVVEGVGAISSIIWRMVNDEDDASQDPLGGGGSDWEISDDTENEFYLGDASQITESSGIFSFGSTGYWSIRAYALAECTAPPILFTLFLESTDDDSTYTELSQGHTIIEIATLLSSTSLEALIKVSDVSLDKIKLRQAASGLGFFRGSSVSNETYLVFEKKSEL
jgi:hypothetical protein